MRLLAVLFCMLSSPAWALTISTPGVHRLTGNVSAVNPIQITANNVLLDLNGYTVTCTPANPATAQTYGIDAANRSNVHIYNGRVTNCYMGIQLANGSNVSIVGVNASGNRYIGANVGFSSGVRVVGSTFNNIAGYSPEAYAIGINGVGNNALIEGNTFRGCDRQPTAQGVGEGVGILVSADTQNVTIRGNWIENDDVSMDCIGVWVGAGSTGIVVTENTITRIAEAIRGAVGTGADNRLYLPEPFAGSTGIDLNTGAAIDNLIVGFDEGFSEGVTDGGGNLILAVPEPEPPAEPQSPETVLDLTLPGSFGNIETKTIKVVFMPAQPTGPVNFVRLTLQAHADEPLILSALYLGSVSLGPVTIPAGQTLTLPWVPYQWNGTSALTVSAYAPGPASSDRLAATTGQSSVTWLRIGNYAAQSGTSGFTAYSGYHSLVTMVETAE